MNSKRYATQAWILGFFFSAFIRDAIRCYRDGEMFWFLVCIVLLVVLGFLSVLWFDKERAGD